MEVEGAEYQLKPMNCPFHVLTFKDTPKSYPPPPLGRARHRLPLRAQGTLNGLFRVRGFTQDDAHIFCPSSSRTNWLMCSSSSSRCSPSLGSPITK